MKIILLFLILLFTSTSTAQACRCYERLSPNEAVEKYDLILVGKVNEKNKIWPSDWSEEKRNKSAPTHVELAFQPLHIFKDKFDNFQQARILTSVGFATCGYRFSKGEYYLIFTNSSTEGSSYGVSGCSPTKEININDFDDIKEILNLQKQISEARNDN